MLIAEVIGNIGNDAEIKEFGGKKYVSFSVAHTENVRTGINQYQEQTVWVQVLWYGEGGNLLQYLKKGAKVFVRGRQRVSIYDKQGTPQISINIGANEVFLCGTRNENHQGNNQANVEQPVDFGQSGDDLPF